MDHTITTVAQLEAIYGEPSSNAVLKEIDHISDHYKAFIEKSPFVTLATCGPEGLDCSPRGDPAGFVRVHDSKTVMLPDRRGNNRIDTLKNIVRDPRVSLLFLIPGVGETLRINGRAEISIDPDLCASFEMQNKLPRSILALARSRLWDPAAQVPRSELPSTGSMIQALSSDGFDGAAYDKGYPDHMKDSVY